MWTLLWIACARAVDPCAELPEADGFDFPVGKPDAEAYYDAQPFLRNRHLGSDWNGDGKGNTDLGDPVSAAASGVVTFSRDLGEASGWGRVVRVAHRVGASCVETVYAHLDRIDVVEGEIVARGHPLGTIGTAHGRYWAHLHFELRNEAGLPLGAGYGEPVGQVDPTAYILAHRP